MKKVLALVLALCMVLALCACGTAATQTAATTAPAEGESIVLKLGVSTNETDPRTVAAQSFADEVKTKTNGAVTVQIYTSGQLGGDADLIEALSLDSGTVDIIITDASNFATYEPQMGISALPFQFKDFDMAWAFMDSDIEAAAEKTLLNDNMRVLAHYCNGFRCLTTSDKKVSTPADMKGLLIRTPENPVIMATMTALGANPQPLAFSELYQALQQGTYDGQENPIPVIYNNNLYEVQKNITITNHIYSGMCFTIAESTWQKLSKDQQDIVAAAAKTSADYDRQMNQQQSEDYLAKLQDAGMNVITPDLTPFKEATAGVAESYRDTYGTMLDDLNTWLTNYKG